MKIRIIGSVAKSSFFKAQFYPLHSKKVFDWIKDKIHYVGIPTRYKLKKIKKMEKKNGKKSR